MSLRTCLVLLSTVLLAGLSPQVLAQGPDRVSVLIQLAPGAARDPVRAFAASEGGHVRYEYSIVPNMINLRNIPVTALNGLRNVPGVTRVSEDPVIRMNLHQSTPLIRGLQSQIQSAGLSANGEGIRICVPDTGIDSNHYMFQDWPDTSQTRIDYAAARNFVTPGAFPEDDHGHGAHVSGIAAGREGLIFNNLPFQGIAPKATIIPVKVLNSAGEGQGSDLIAAFQHCTDPNLSGGPADVISVSLGYGAFSDRNTCETEEVVQAANAAVLAGAVVVAASGNEGASNALAAPACGSQVISVGGTWDRAGLDLSYCLTYSAVDQVLCFSNRSDMLDVVAPGCGIHSAATDLIFDLPYGGIEMCGTSMAAPHVAGLAALLHQINPGLNPSEIRQCIRDGAIDKGPAGFDPAYGYGRIDVINSLNLCRPAGPPNQPPVARFTFSCDGLACLFDGSGSSDPDGSITHYSWTFGDSSTAQGATASHTYAAVGTYVVTLTVVDDDGASQAQPQNVTVAAPPVSVPDAPSNLNVQIVTTGTGKKAKSTANLSWTDNAGNETNYIVHRYRRTGRKNQQGCSFELEITLPANTTAYVDSGVSSATCKYAVAARNSAGPSGFVEAPVPVP